MPILKGLGIENFGVFNLGHTFFWSATPCAPPPPPRPSNYFWGVHHPVNRDDRHLLAHAMPSDLAIWYLYCHFDIFIAILILRAILVHFPPFWFVVPRKIWQPCI
jgi:hypothetical protein